MRLISSLLFISLIFSSAGIFAQDKWTNIDYQTSNTGANGLVGQFIYEFLEDKDGRIWIGTASGISIWDGLEWETVTTNEGLRVNEVMDIVEDDQYNIWIGYGSSFAGVSKYDGTEWEHYNTSNGLVHNKVNTIFKDDDGNLWIGTMGGLSVYNGSDWTNYTTLNGLPDNDIQSIAQDNTGAIWIGTANSGVWKFDGVNFINPDYPIPTDCISSIYFDSFGKAWICGAIDIWVYDTFWQIVDTNVSAIFWTIYGDKNDNIYIGTNEGLLIFEEGNWKLVTQTDGLPADYILSIYETSKGVILVGTENGMAVNNGEGWSEITTGMSGLINNKVNYIFKDSSGNIWFCTDGGISKYDGQFWESNNHLPNGDLIEWVMDGIEDKDGNFWFCAVNGIIFYDGTSWDIFDYYYNEFFSGWPKDVLEDKDGNLWFATSDYLRKYDGVTWTRIDDNEGIPSRYVLSLFEDRDSNIWIGSSEGVSKWDGEGFTHYIKGETFPVLSTVESFVSDSSGCIMAMGDHGLAIFNGDTWELMDNAPSVWYKDGYIDDNEVFWFATWSGGLYKYDGLNWTLYTTNDGLIDNAISSIYREDSGNFWFGTQNGVSKLIPVIESEVNSNPKGSIQLASKGITQPYQFSIDNINYEKNEGIFNGVDDGTYNIYITNAYDTLILRNIQILSTGIEEKSIGILRIYPNPITDYAIIEFPNEEGELYNLNIIDLNGKVVKQITNIKDSRISINKAGLKPGYYLIELRGPRLFQGKILIN